MSYKLEEGIAKLSNVREIAKDVGISSSILKRSDEIYDAINSVFGDENDEDSSTRDDTSTIQASSSRSQRTIAESENFAKLFQKKKNENMRFSFFSYLYFFSYHSDSDRLKTEIKSITIFINIKTKKFGSFFYLYFR